MSSLRIQPAAPDRHDRYLLDGDTIPFIDLHLPEEPVTDAIP